MVGGHGRLRTNTDDHGRAGVLSAADVSCVVIYLRGVWGCLRWRRWSRGYRLLP